MSYGEIEGKFLGPREEVTSEPRCKKLKSTTESKTSYRSGKISSYNR
uniref:NEDD4 binding protein 2 like 2 n=1 Tax=Homo sapiens TaxID=9606 RepID=A0A6I8PRR5_HUMAN